MLRTVTYYSCASPYRSPRLFRRSSSSEHGSHPDTSVSSRLWADAIEEEREGVRNPTRLPMLAQPSNYPNWTGDESVQDAVLRMLVDKYKPLRSAAIRTAEEKLKSTPPSLHSLEPSSLPTSSESSFPPVSTSESTSESTTTHKPWLTTFRPPSHATSIRYMRLPPPLATKPNIRGPPVHPDDSRTRIVEREQKKKAAFAGRLTNARESSLDYRIGKTAIATGDPRVHRPNPVNVKGWTSLVEERIERARSEGHFRSIKGRGKPIARDNEQSNHFIPREEFLMNRIVQRQGAAPPWVEFQGELDTAVSSFRGILQSTWTRRAVRSLMLEHPPAVLPRLTLADVTGRRMHDREWEAREKWYHEEAIREINALVRKYNGVAPYAVRRSYLTREAELQRMYEVSGEDILAEIRRKSKAGDAGELAMGGGSLRVETDAGSGQGGGDGGEVQPIGFGLGVIWKRWVAKLVGG